MASIKLPDGSIKEVPDGTTVAQVAEGIGRGLAKAAIVGKVDGNLVDLAYPLSGSHDLQIITERDPEALTVLLHSTAHVMAEAIQRIWPEAKLAYGPPLEKSFYYDISLDKPISTNDFERIEKKMAEIVKENRPFNRYELNAEDAFGKLRAEGNKYKLDNAIKAVGAQLGEARADDQDRALQAALQGRRVAEILTELLGPAPAAEKLERFARQVEHPPSLSFYVTGEKGKNWEDLCRGPHVPSTARVRAFKVTSVAQSHWHGNVKSDPFQRVYGTAFFDQKQLDEHFRLLDEAKKRDHRIIGPQLGLFTIDEQVGQGLVLWKPKGAIVRQQLQDFISEHLRRQGYSQVFTPHIGRLELYKTSGHYPYYKESQFPPLVDRELIDSLAKEGCSCSELANRMEKGAVDGYLLKPMNCPMHIRIFASEQRSYRDMPVRLAEFGTVYRWEKSGELGGMTRVRGFTQDDAHLFVTEDQLSAELMGCLDLVKIIFGTLGMHDYRVRVGLRDPDSTKYVGTPEQWDKAEKACKEAAASLGVPFSPEPGEAAFYGPKIDFVVRDVIGREWQLGTVQVDYQLPQRFDLSYTGADNKPHRPVMIHRAPFGSMERFIGVLIEHFAGAFPLWLAPVQVSVLTISEKFNDCATKVATALNNAGLRAESSLGSDKIGHKIRAATMQKVPYMLVLGEQEQAAEKVAVRHRTEGDKGQMSLEEFIQRCDQEVSSRGVAPAVS